jgi:tetratricopeptide (TPR) repeat protein
MPQDHSELYYQHESTRHFLYSKAETDDLPKKQIRTAAISIQAAVQSIYPALLTGHSFLEHSAQHLSSANTCACGVIQIDMDGSSDFEQTNAEQTAAYQTAAKIIDELCMEHNGIWGLVESGLYGVLFGGKKAQACLKLIQKFQETIKKQTDTTASAGIAECSKLNNKPAEMLIRALKALDHASFFGPNSAVIFDAVSLNISGDKLFDKGDIKGSIEEFKQALKLDPSNINVHNSLGVCYGLRGDYKKAKLEFITAIKLDSTEVMSRYNLGFTNMLEGNRQKALDLFLKANTINQDVFEIAFQTGRLLMEMSQAEKGKKFLEHASRLKPQSAAVFRYLGECYTSIGKIDNAIVAYKKAIKQNPSDAASLSALGFLFDQQGENPEISLMFCQESVKLSPENGLFRYRLGQLYFKQNRLDDALKEFKKADSLGHDASEYITKIQNQLPAKAL